MINRYSYPDMAIIFSEENEFAKYLEVELAVAESMSELGQIPVESMNSIREKAKFSIQRIRQIEKETNHDLISFLQAVTENIGDAGKYLHMGLTSSDVKDTALALQMIDAIDLLLLEFEKIENIVLEKANENKFTLMIGRTHGVHAEPITFGLKMLLWVDEIRRSIERLKKARSIISFGKISGAVGTYANISPDVESRACDMLNVKHEKISTQIIQRDRHAEVLSTLAIIASSLEKFASEIRTLQRTDILEIEEYFSDKQKGSSAMPHKKNPILCERIAGLARVVRANSIAGLENINLWNERDLTHSSVERVIIPDSFILLHYMAVKFQNVMSNIVVHKDNMLANINKTHGLIFSQRVMLAMIEKGMDRKTAYELVQKNAMKTWNEKSEFIENISSDLEISKILSSAEIKNIFSFDYYTKYVDEVFKRF